MAMTNLESAINGFRSIDDVASWAKGGGSVDDLRAVMENPRLSAMLTGSLYVRAWFAKELDARQGESFDLNRRATEAAEESAKQARHSAWAASIAVGVALIALAVSTVALFKA